MYKNISLNQISKLESVKSSCCVTIYISLGRGVSNSQKNLLKYKNELKDVRKKLNGLKVSTAEKQKAVNKLEKVLAKLEHNSEGGVLAVFYHDNKLLTYILSGKMDLSCKVGGSLDLKPAKKIMREAKSYYILTLGQKGARLFIGSGEGVNDISSKTIRKGLSDTLSLDEWFNTGVQNHPINRGGTKNSEGFHGHNEPKDKRKDLIEKYMRELDKEVNKLTEDKSKKLVLVSVGYVQDIYRKITKYPNLAKRGIKMNADHLTPGELAQKL